MNQDIVLGALFGSPFKNWSNGYGELVLTVPVTAPLIGCGQRFEWSYGGVSVEGFSTADGALWSAARMMYRLATPRVMRKTLDKDQRTRLIEIARRKLGN